LRHILNYISGSISFNINANDKLKTVFNSTLKGSMFRSANPPNRSVKFYGQFTANLSRAAKGSNLPSAERSLLKRETE
jgi:hypothetical protein